MLSQNPSAIRMRRHRARIRSEALRRPRGRHVDLGRHVAFIAAYDAAESKGAYALDRLMIREGYATRKSLRNGYRWAKQSLATAAKSIRGNSHHA